MMLECERRSAVLKAINYFNGEQLKIPPPWGSNIDACSQNSLSVVSARSCPPSVSNAYLYSPGNNIIIYYTRKYSNRNRECNLVMLILSIIGISNQLFG